MSNQSVCHLPRLEEQQVKLREEAGEPHRLPGDEEPGWRGPAEQTSWMPPPLSCCRESVEAASWCGRSFPTVVTGRRAQSVFLLQFSDRARDRSAAD